MYFVYLIKSITTPEKIYVGYTENISVRLEEHNLGISFHTAKYKPWELVSFFAFQSQSRALEFEQYLKTGSGRIFLKRHLL